MRDYDPTTGRYLQADPLGLVDGASVYGYALQNPGRWVDPRGEETEALHNYKPFEVFPWGGGSAIGKSPAVLPSPQAISAIAAIIGGTIVGSGPSSGPGEGGKAGSRAPYSHSEENEALKFPLDPWGGGDYCERLKRAIWILRANLAWRLKDANPRSDSYRGHLTRIAILRGRLKQMEANYELVCRGPCPPEH